MMLKGLIYAAMFLNWFLVWEIVGTDSAKDDVSRICKLTLFVQSVNILTFFICAVAISH